MYPGWKTGRPQNVLLVPGEAIAKLITRLAKPRLDMFPSLLYDLDNKRALYDHWLVHDEKGVETNPFPSRPIYGKARRYAMLNQNLPSFISSDGTNNPFSTKRKGFFTSGK